MPRRKKPPTNPDLNVNSAIGLSLEIVEFLAQESTKGNDKATELLKRCGVEPQTLTKDPIVIYQSDGEIAAWIV